MNFRAFGRLRFSGFGLPGRGFEERFFLPKPSFLEAAEFLRFRSLLLMARAPGRLLKRTHWGRHRNLPRRLKSWTAPTLVAGSLAVLMLVSLGQPTPAEGATIRSTGNEGCTVDVGDVSRASIARSGNDCIVTVTASTTLTFPSYVTSTAVILVGGGGGGGADGGSGGGGGQVRWSNSQPVNAGQTVTVTIGAGGLGTRWSGQASTAGGTSELSGAGLTYRATGGSPGLGWNWCNPNDPGVVLGGSGGTGGSGGSGGSGRIGSCEGD